ncbi:MAG TPA: ankyrin repeat domain-containing protein, partial [Acidimicrobiia bacterium]|nr:ankyrin repeat domain-containing protein [Acidimicrobiia bacterium]
MKRLLVFGVILIAFAAGAGFVIGGMVDQHRPRRTPLSVAVDDGDVNAVKSLLAHGADPNEGDEYLPPLFLAVGNDRVAIVRLLVDAGADPNRE